MQLWFILWAFEKKDVSPILWERLWGVANKNTHNDILQFIKFRWICLSFLNCYCMKTKYEPLKIRIWGGISYIIFKRPFEFKLASTAAQVTDQISVVYILFRLSLYRIQLLFKVYQTVIRFTSIKYTIQLLTYRQYRRLWIEIWFCHPVTDQQTGAWHLWTLVSWYYHCHLYQKCERHVLRRKAEKINNYLFTWLHKDIMFCSKLCIS